MVRIILYGIVTEQRQMQTWVCPSRKSFLKGYFEKVKKRVKGEQSKIVRSLHLQGFWVYYFQQQGFLFILVSEGSERSARMQNYLRVVADIFYESYDERYFPTILDRLMNEINRIEGSQMTEQEHQGLIVRNFQSQKQKFNDLLRRKEQQSKLAYCVSAILFLCILILAMYYLLVKKVK